MSWYLVRLLGSLYVLLLRITGFDVLDLDCEDVPPAYEDPLLQVSERFE